MEPTASPQRSGVRIAVAITAILVLATGVALVLLSRPHPEAKKPVAFVEPTDGESAVQRALRLASVDSTKKTTWVDEVPGSDLKILTAGRREVFLRFVNSERCTCGCGFTLGACRQYDSSCEVSLPRVKRLYDSVATGQLTDATGLRTRPGAR